jgi:hypothetical protein
MGSVIAVIIALIVGAVGGIGVYWYFVRHRKLIDIPDDLVKK